MKLLHLNEKCRHARAAGVEVGLELCSCLTFKSKRMNKTLPPFSFTMSLCVCVCVCVCARAVQSVMNMMHVISVPYSLMKVNPLSWIQKVCQYKGQTHTPPATQLSPLSPFTCLSDRLNANFSVSASLCVSVCVCVRLSPQPRWRVWSPETCTGLWWPTKTRRTSTWAHCACCWWPTDQTPVRSHSASQQSSFTNRGV